MQIAIDLAGQTRWPADSKIHVHGDNIKKILFGIDIRVAEILMGRELGVDCVMAHHPDPSVLTFPDVLDLHVDIMVRNGVPEDEAWEAVNTLKPVLSQDIRQTTTMRRLSRAFWGCRFSISTILLTRLDAS